MGSRKSRMKVSTKEDMHTSLKALRKEERESSDVLEDTCRASSTLLADEVPREVRVVSLAFSSSAAEVVHSAVSTLGWTIPSLSGRALIARVVSQ